MILANAKLPYLIYFSNIPNTEYYPDPKLQYANNYPRQMKTLQERDENENLVTSGVGKCDIWILYIGKIPSHVIHPFSLGWLQDISIIESLCISVTVQVCNIYIDPNCTSYLWIFQKLKSSMPIKLQWVTNLFLQNQV